MVGAVAKDLMKFDLGIVDNLNLWMFVLSIVLKLFNWILMMDQ